MQKKRKPTKDGKHEKIVLNKKAGGAAARPGAASQYQQSRLARNTDLSKEKRKKSERSERCC